MRSTLDNLVRLGRVSSEIVRLQNGGGVIVSFVAYPLQDGVPATLSDIGSDTDEALDRLWNQLVDALPQGWPNHIKEVSR